ncbi:MAG: hypothetical protein JWL90_171, partial [Chthoniobacteraceae bacterium]|nr:hypothetical protein [Chthoniobacteraceae bacterium]
PLLDGFAQSIRAASIDTDEQNAPALEIISGTGTVGSRWNGGKRDRGNNEKSENRIHKGGAPSMRYIQKRRHS